MKRKALALLLAAVMTTAMLAGCGKTQTGGSDGASQGTTPAGTEKEADASSAGSGEKAELTMWGSWSGDQVAQLEKQLEGFNNSQDKYHVTYMVQDGMEQKLLTAIASNEVPDIVLWDRFNTGVYAPKGALASLDDYIAKDNVDMTQFYAPAVDEMTSAGVVYGIPLTVDSRVLFYNKDLLDEAGVDPASITDWDSLRDAAIKLTKWDGDKLVQSGFSLKDVGLFNNWIGQAGGKMIDDSTNPPTAAFNTEAGLTVLKYWDQLLNQDKVYQLGFEDGFGGDGFKAGKVAITFNGPWTLESYKEAGLNFGVIGQPQGYNGEKSGYLYFNGKRLDADDDYRLYYYDGDIYLVNKKGKVQKSSKKYDLENKGIAEDDVEVTISGKKVTKIKGSNFEYTDDELVAEMINEINGNYENVTDDMILSVPFIQLYDDDLYTYTEIKENSTPTEGWLGLNNPNK